MSERLDRVDRERMPVTILLASLLSGVFALSAAHAAEHPVITGEAPSRMGGGDLG